MKQTILSRKSGRTQFAQRRPTLPWRVLSVNSPIGCSVDKQPVTGHDLRARRGAPFTATRAGSGRLAERRERQSSDICSANASGAITATHRNWCSDRVDLWKARGAQPLKRSWSATRSAAACLLRDPAGRGAGAGQLLTVLGYIHADAVSSGKRRKDRFTAPGTGRREPNTSCGEPRQTADISVAASDSFEAVPRTTTAQASGPRERTPRCRRSARYPRASPRSARGRAAPRRRRARRSARRSA
jgi:hypothetical protein